ncbi:MAG: permease-like cell division protein FtsX [Legionellaceae bacterium]|nr:permease-like cell division protein FtsX [Legionellaceae bacterium]
MNMKSWIAFHKQALQQSIGFICKQPLPTLMTTVIIALTLSLASLFWIFSDAITQLTTNWQRSSHISLYLDTSVSSGEVDSLVERITTTAGVGEVNLKTPQQGLEILQAQEGMQDVMLYLPENPLPTVIDVIPAVTINTPKAIEQLFGVLKSYQHVEQAKLDIESINHLFTFLNFISKLMHALMIMLALAVVLVIGNTLRLIIQDRHDEIMVLKLIGAGDAFIMRPFLYSGIWYGLIAAILAVICVDLFVFSLNTKINQLVVYYQMHFSLSGMSIAQSILLFLIATTLGFLGARFSVKRHLVKNR